MKNAPGFITVLAISIASLRLFNFNISSFMVEPGCAPLIEEDVLPMDFSPDKELEEVMTHVAKKMEAMG